MIDEYIYIKKAAAEDDPEKRREYLMKFIRATQDPEGVEAAAPDRIPEEEIAYQLKRIADSLESISQFTIGMIGHD